MSDIIEELVKQIALLQYQIDALIKPEIPLPGKITPFGHAYKSAVTANVTGDSTTYTFIFDTEIIDQTGSYNNANGVFTAPRAGYYLFKAHMLVGEIGAAHTQAQALLSTSNRNYYSSFINPYAISTGGFCPLWVECFADMDAGDTAVCQVQVIGGTKTVDAYGSGTFLHSRLHIMYLRPLSY